MEVRDVSLGVPALSHKIYVTFEWISCRQVVYLYRLKQTMPALRWHDGLDQGNGPVSASPVVNLKCKDIKL